MEYAFHVVGFSIQCGVKHFTSHQLPFFIWMSSESRSPPQICISCCLLPIFSLLLLFWIPPSPLPPVAPLHKTFFHHSVHLLNARVKHRIYSLVPVIGKLWDTLPIIFFPLLMNFVLSRWRHLRNFIDIISFRILLPSPLSGKWQLSRPSFWILLLALDSLIVKKKCGGFAYHWC